MLSCSHSKPTKDFLMLIEESGSKGTIWVDYDAGEGMQREWSPHCASR